MITVNEDGSVVIRLAVHVRPKGSGTPVLSKTTKQPFIIWDTPEYKRVQKAVVKQLRQEWGDRPPLAVPMRYSAFYNYRRPKTNHDPYPLTVGDLSKLMRRAEDWLAGSRKEPGPILADDKWIVETGQHARRWSESDGVVIKLTPIGGLR